MRRAGAGPAAGFRRPVRSLADSTAAVLGAGWTASVVYSVGDDDPYLQVVLQRRLPVVVDQPKILRSVVGSASTTGRRCVKLAG